MSRFYNNCVDEASLTTLCPICLDCHFQGGKRAFASGAQTLSRRSRMSAPTARFAMVSIIMYSPIRTLSSM